jgi:hypothetical protein
MRPLIVGAAILAVLLFRGTYQHFAPRAKVPAVEILDPAPVRGICQIAPDMAECKILNWRERK